jgi:phenylacetate-CoA ligase
VTVSSGLRRSAFWSLDRLRGGPIRRHVEDIRNLLSGGRPDPSVLADLLAHATSTTPAYEPYAGCDLQAFPVLGRMDLKSRPDAYRSRAFRSADLLERRTSGSTGVPLTIVQDPGKRRRAIADLIAFNEAAGQRVGDRLLWLYSARLFPHGRTKGLRQNIIAVDHVGLDEERMAAVVGILRNARVNAVLSVPSTLAALARHLERSGQVGKGFGLRVVIATGESLDLETKARIAAAFGCPVVDRYANEESGVLASTLPHDDLAHLNVASYLVELLDVDADEPAGPGEPGRVVVTDLYNRAMPLIRYDTGDLAVASDADEGGPRTLSRIEGRRADTVRTPAGGIISAPMVSAFMAKRFPDLEQYRLVQVGPASYRLSVVPGSLPADVDRLATDLRELLGADARVAVEVVAGIAVGATGKRRVVFSEWQPGRQDDPSMSSNQSGGVP